MVTIMLKNKLYDYQQQFQEITHSGRITALLKQCIQNKNRLHVSLSRGSDIFSCEVLTVDHDAGVAHLSELRPNRGQKLFAESGRIQVFTHINGAEVSFECDVINSRNPLIRTKNQVSLPTLIKYCQRRRAHRVHISLSLAVSASLDYDADGLLEGQLRDISSEGMRIQFQRVPKKLFEELEAVPACHITLPDMTKIYCQFEVRHLHGHQHNRGCDVGGIFRDLDQTQARSIEKFIATIERKALREHRL